MILRVIRGRVTAGREADFVEICRRTVAERARSPGLVSFFPGYRRVSGSDWFLLASAWESAELANQSAGPPDNSNVSSVLAEVAEIESFDVFEALEPTFNGIVDAPGGVIRLTSAYLVPEKRAQLLAWLAAHGREKQPQRLVLGWALGERRVDDREQMLAVSAWPSQLVVEALTEPGSQSGLLFAGADEFVTDVAVETYQAIGLELPSELSDLSARQVLAARFGERPPADAAAEAVVRDIPSAGEVPVSVAPLGAPGTASDVRSWILVVRVSATEYPRAERLVADHGGQVILATREAVADDDEASASSAVDAAQPRLSVSPAN